MPIKIHRIFSEQLLTMPVQPLISSTAATPVAYTAPFQFSSLPNTPATRDAPISIPPSPSRAHPPSPARSTTSSIQGIIAPSLPAPLPMQPIAPINVQIAARIIQHWSFGTEPVALQEAKPKARRSLSSVSSPAAPASQLKFGFWTPREDSPATGGFIPAEEIFKKFLGLFPDMPLRVQHLLACYIGMPTSLANLWPHAIIDKEETPICSGIVIIEFDQVLTKYNLTTSGAIDQLNNISTNLKSEYQFIWGNEHLSLENLLAANCQIIVISKSYDVELILAHLMNIKLFGAALIWENPSLLHNVHLVVTPMKRQGSINSAYHLVGYAMRCLYSGIFPVPITQALPISIYTTDLKVSSDWERYISLPNRSTFEMTCFTVANDTSEKFNYWPLKPTLQITSEDQNPWQPQNYQVSYWKNVFCPKCYRESKAVPAKINPVCTYCNFLLLTKDEVHTIQKFQQQCRNFLIRKSERLFQTMQEALREDYRDSGVAMLELSREDDNLEVPAYEFADSDSLWLVKRYLTYQHQAAGKNIFTPASNLTAEIIADKQQAVRYCPSANCLYSDAQGNNFCVAHRAALIRLHADKYLKDQQEKTKHSAAMVFQKYYRGHRAFSQYKILLTESKQESFQWWAIASRRYQILKSTAKNKIPNFSADNTNKAMVDDAMLNLLLPSAQQHTLKTLLQPRSNTFTIPLSYGQCSRIANFLIIHLFSRPESHLKGLAALQAARQSQVENSLVAFCTNTGCPALGAGDYRFNKEICQLCTSPLLVFKSQPSKAIPFKLAIQLIAKQTEVETQLALLSQGISSIPTNAPSSMFPSPVQTLTLFDFLRSNDQSALLYADLRELICEFGLLRKFSWRHSCMLEKLATVQPIAAVLASNTEMLSRHQDAALLTIGVKSFPCGTYRKLIVGDNVFQNAAETQRYQEYVNAYFGAPLLPKELAQQPSATPKTPKASPPLPEAILYVFEFESFLKQAITISSNAAGGVLNINPQNNIHPDAKSSILQSISLLRQPGDNEGGIQRELLIAFICQTWDLALVEQYLNAIDPNIASQCIIITNPASANGYSYGAVDIFRQLQYLCQAVWAKQRWIRDIHLIHRDANILESFLTTFNIRISDITKEIGLPGKLAWTMTEAELSIRRFSRQSFVSNISFYKNGWEAMDFHPVAPSSANKP